MNKNNTLSFIKIIIYKLFNFISGFIFLFLIFGTLFYLSFKEFIPNLNNSQHLVFILIFSIILISKIKDWFKIFNKINLLNYYSEKIDYFEKELKNRQEIFNVNKQFIYKKLEIEKINSRPLNTLNNFNLLEELINIYKKNEEILLNNEMIDSIFEIKEELEQIKFNLEDLYISFKDVKYKKEVVLELDDLKKSLELVKEIIENIKNNYTNYIDSILEKINELENKEDGENNMNLINLKGNINSIKLKLHSLNLNKINKK